MRCDGEMMQRERERESGNEALLSFFSSSPFLAFSSRPPSLRQPMASLGEARAVVVRARE